MCVCDIFPTILFDDGVAGEVSIHSFHSGRPVGGIVSHLTFPFLFQFPTDCGSVGPRGGGRMTV